VSRDWVVDVQEARLHLVRAAPGSLPGCLGRLRESVDQTLAALHQG
jgi:hypothetical protein